ncbi:MAG: hypothetical protein JXN64_15655 [Spirochaetes bacterium]|nr:hypothetical protein [Spirochaetota bacterium]
MILYLRSILFVVIFFLINIHTAVYSDQRQKIQSFIYKEYSASYILGFTKYLISIDEFYRASVELKRLESYYPGYIKNDNLLTTELFLLFNGRRYSEIILTDFNDSSQGVKAIHTIFKTDALIQKRDFINANMIINSGNICGKNKDIDLFLYKRTILLYLLLNKIDEARNIFNNRMTGYPIAGLSNMEFIESIEFSEHCFASVKKPYAAMAFGIIPGMGYVYADKTATGIIAFLLISALSTLTYYSFKTDNKPVGIFVGTAATFFYGGSIIGGYLTSKKYNDTAINDLRDSLTQRMRLAEDREEIYNKYGIGNIGK